MRGVIPTGRFITFQAVRTAFRSQGFIYSPLLKPVDEIERILLGTGYLKEGEHLDSFDINKERFPVVTYEDQDKPLTKFQNFRFKLAQYILP